MGERIEALEKLIDYKFESHRRALELQAREYERRLESLNHENARISKSNELYIGREVLDRVCGQHESRLNLLRFGVGQPGRKMWGVGCAVGGVVTAINILVIYLHK